jgi:HD-GYP domain-containing protein (c-di-GMP phosphodiesterase class II)
VFRTLELLGGLSLVTDIGTGSPLEESLKRCLVAARLARMIGCTDSEVSDVLYTALLQHLGCTAYSHEAARVWGDDVITARVNFLSSSGELKDMWRLWIPGIAKATGRSKARALATTVVTAGRMDAEGTAATCEVARAASQGLGLPEPVQVGLSHMFAMWNGKGFPRTAGEEIPLAARLMQVALTAVMFASHANIDVAVAEVQRRAGTQIDPNLAELLVERAGELLADLDEIDAYQAVLDIEPAPVRRVAKDELADVARTFGNLVDLKSPWLHGHSAGVGDLAAAAAGMLGLRDDVDTVRVAGYLHDLGRVGVSSAIWDKAGPLSGIERDQARLHAYHSERILARIPPLTGLAKLVGQHHERCDGSGYHRGSTAAQLSMTSRVLACADAYRRWIEDRPYRRALVPARAADRLEAEARAGRLDHDAAAAVIEAAGLRRAARRSRPADLTERQVEVLRLVSRGLSNAEIADRLVLSRRTVEHHVQDVYLKIGASTRAGAAMFAMQHGLLDQSR